MESGNEREPPTLVSLYAVGSSAAGFGTHSNTLYGCLDPLFLWSVCLGLPRSLVQGLFPVAGERQDRRTHTYACTHARTLARSLARTHFLCCLDELYLTTDFGSGGPIVHASYDPDLYTVNSF